MAALLPQQAVVLGDPVWKACVDAFLLKAVDIDSQVEKAALYGVLCPFIVAPWCVACELLCKWKIAPLGRHA